MPSRVHRPAGVCAALCLVLLATSLAGCSGSRDSAARTRAAAAETAAAGDPRPLEVVVVRPGLDPSGVFHSFLRPVVDAPVVARQAGIVRSVTAVEGRRVARGQVLARLDDDDQRLELERAQALAAQAHAEHERARRAAATNLISQHELEVARAKELAARAEAGRARLALERCTLRAPVAGVVRLVRAVPNGVVEEGEELFRVAETVRLRADLYLPPALHGRLAVGDLVTVAALTDPASTSAVGRVRLVNPVADPVTGLFHVEVDLPASPGLGPGVDVRIVPRGEAAAALASSPLGGALLPHGAYVERRGDTLFAFRVRDGVVRRVPVSLGEAGPDGFAVHAGLAPGDLVARAGAAPPADGARVSPRVGAPLVP